MENVLNLNIVRTYMIFETPNFQNFKLINNFGPYKYTDEDGNIRTTLDGEYHSFNDQPAIIYYDGEKRWFKNGQLHRDNDLPAIEYENGSKEWWINGKLHRENNLPSIIYSSGIKAWYKNGVFIREHI